MDVSNVIKVWNTIERTSRAPVPKERERVIYRPWLRTSALALVAFAGACLPALADQRYEVSGNDLYQVGEADLQTTISYTGTQQLVLKKEGAHTRLEARVQYTRTDAAGKVPAQASFVQEMSPAGELKDKSDSDPDYLTVLNQPFAAMVDGGTLHDLLHLHGDVPFTFPAPMIGGQLHGYLRRGAVSRVDNRPALAVDFDATGPMVGPLPDHSGMSISGKMRMRGTAYYAVHGPALLLALRETLTITGKLQQRTQSSPVKIEYQRMLRAQGSAEPQTEAYR